MSDTLLFYIGLAVVVVVFVAVRHSDPKAAVEGRLGATDGAGSLATVCFFFVVVAALIFLLG